MFDYKHGGYTHKGQAKALVIMLRAFGSNEFSHYWWPVDDSPEAWRVEFKLALRTTRRWEVAPGFWRVK